MLEWSDMAISDGTDRRDRLAPALQPGYFKVDELVFEQLLAMGAEFAAQVNYYNLDNRIAGNWGELFSADEAVIMAMILATDLKRMETEYLRLAYGDISPLAAYVLRWADSVNFWLGKLDAGGQRSGTALQQKLAAIVDEKLAPALHAVGEILGRLDGQKAPTAAADFSGFGAAWGIKRAGKAFQFPRVKLDAGAGDQNVRGQLRSAFYAFFNAVSYLKTVTPAYLQESLGSQQHDPASGLFMVFLALYEKAQQAVNRFTERHLDFYYRQVLLAKPRAASPDSVHLVLDAPAGMPAAMIEAGREFSAGKDAQLNDVIYCADTDLWLSDARVTSLYTLYLQHDDLVAPESELGYATRIKAGRPPLAGTHASGATPWPLFGEEKAGLATRQTDDAEIGFSVASPLLRLEEGVRRIELDIALQDTIRVDADTLVAMLARSHNAAGFRKLFGRLFSRYLLAQEGWLSRANKAKIISIATALLQRGSADEVESLLSQDRQGLFYKLLKRIFRIRLSTADGWHSVQDYSITPLAAAKGGDGLGFSVCLTLGQDVDPIAPYDSERHGTGLQTEHPVFECCINPQTHFYPYSLFSDLTVKALDIDVAVTGINNLLLYNNHGQLDPSKPFAPFGPLPGGNAYFIFGNYELAQKKLLELRLNLEWGELPKAAGGFAEHYRAYPSDYDNDVFKGGFAVLADGHWQPREVDADKAMPLFARDAESGRLKADKQLQVNVLHYAKPLSAAIGEDDYNYDLGSRNGFFKFCLTGPEGAFGHREYPAQLTWVLAQNARRKKPLPTPNPPYTPVLNRISLDYRARGTINPALDPRGVQDGKREMIFHHHPFGVETVYPAATDKPPALLPQYAHQGNLFIGLSARQLRGTLTLLFHLSEDHAQELAAETPPLSWFYLTGDNWKRLAATEVLADTTNGFLSSGTVTLRIPDDIRRAVHVMPRDHYWLRLSAKQELHGFCSCHAVYTNAVKLTRKQAAEASQALQTKWQPMRAIPGIAAIRQVGGAFGGRAGEDESAFKTRLSERLRHKNRASVPWDYERLVLEQFPAVAKVKCFANMRSRQQAPAPGYVLIVVVPQVAETLQSNAQAMISSVELTRIRNFLRRHSSPFIKLEVRNPAYEQVQIRCTVKFASDLVDAAGVNRLDRDISDYLSPWRRVGKQARFGWSMRQKDVESYIRELDYVDFVTNFSMLHITTDGTGHYRLGDTAKTQQLREMEIRPRFPWGLMLPARHHFIETMPVAHSIEAEVTGIDELEIGNTFIISGSS